MQLEVMFAETSEICTYNGKTKAGEDCGPLTVGMRVRATTAAYYAHELQVMVVKSSMLVSRSKEIGICVAETPGVSPPIVMAFIISHTLGVRRAVKLADQFKEVVLQTVMQLQAKWDAANNIDDEGSTITIAEGEQEPAMERPQKG